MTRPYGWCSLPSPNVVVPPPSFHPTLILWQQCRILCLPNLVSYPPIVPWPDGIPFGKCVEDQSEDPASPPPSNICRTSPSTPLMKRAGKSPPYRFDTIRRVILGSRLDGVVISPYLSHPRLSLVPFVFFPPIPPLGIFGNPEHSRHLPPPLPSLHSGLSDIVLWIASSRSASQLRIAKSQLAPPNLQPGLFHA